MTDTFTAGIDNLSSIAWLNGCLAMRYRVAKLLLSMGEHELASMVAVMDPPSRENWNSHESASEMVGGSPVTAAPSSRGDKPDA